MRAAFVGLDAAATGRDDRGGPRGVCHSLRDAQQARCRRGVVAARADLIGGGARSPLWSQWLSDVLGMTLHQIADSDHGCALGAARLGRLAAGDDLGCARKPRRLRSFEPRPDREARHVERHLEWRRLYPMARELAR